MNKNYKLIYINQGDGRILQFWMDEINQDFIVGREEKR
jgi:hypothetical protein